MICSLFRLPVYYINIYNYLYILYTRILTWSFLAFAPTVLFAPRSSRSPQGSHRNFPQVSRSIRLAQIGDFMDDLMEGFAELYRVSWQKTLRNDVECDVHDLNPLQCPLQNRGLQLDVPYFYMAIPG